MPKVEALTTAAVARRLAVSTRTVKRWAAEGRLPTIEKIDGRTGPYLFAESQVRMQAAKLGVVPIGELAAELHPGDPEGHGLEVIGMELFGIPDPDPDTGVIALDVVALRQRARNGLGCAYVACIQEWSASRAADDVRPPDGWYEI